MQVQSVCRVDLGQSTTASLEHGAHSAGSDVGCVRWTRSLEVLVQPRYCTSQRAVWPGRQLGVSACCWGWSSSRMGLQERAVWVGKADTSCNF